MREVEGVGIRRKQHFELKIINSLRNTLSILEPDQLISYLRQNHCSNPTEPTIIFRIPPNNIPIIPKDALQKLVPTETLEPMPCVSPTLEILFEWPFVFA